MMKTLNQFRAQSSETGFSLTNLVLTILILGTLTAIAVPTYATRHAAEVDNGVKADVRTTASTITEALATTPHAPDVASLLEETTGEAVTHLNVSDPSTELFITGTWNDYRVLATNPSTQSVYCYASLVGYIQSGSVCASIEGYPAGV